MLPGIKVDIGVRTIDGTLDEGYTMGLDNLADRVKEYYDMGCRFAKWRCVLKIDAENGLPSDLAITEAAHGLARYA